MSLLDLLRQEHVKGRVVDKYMPGNGNAGLVTEDGRARWCYIWNSGRVVTGLALRTCSSS